MTANRDAATTIICKLCGGNATRTGTVQKYCRPCSAEKSRERGRIWARDNPPKVHRDLQRVWSDKKARLEATGAAISIAEASTIGSVGRVPEYAWMVRFSVPYSLDSSKNRIWSLRGHHLALREQAKAYRAAVEAATRRALRDQPVVKNKVWLSFFVQKQNHRSDAINVVDVLADAIKNAVRVDDRWFCIDRVDWEIVKSDQAKIFITIAQESTDPARVCSYCGRVLALDRFRIDRNRSDGLRRECFDCAPVKRPAAVLVETVQR